MEIFGNIKTRIRANWISILTVIFLLGIWEVTSHLVEKSPLQDAPKVPPLEYVFGKAFIGLSDYWKIDMLAPVPQQGGAQTVFGAVLALILNASITLYRVTVGLVLGCAIGTGIGLLVSSSRRLNIAAALPVHILRMIPLLALIPLFQFWFGANNMTAIVFVAYGVAVTFVVGTINAVSNVPKTYIEYAQTQGLSQFKIYRRVVVPAIIPELFSTAYLCIGIAWTAVIGAEFIGVDSGLGRIVIWANFFSNTGRMVLAAVVIVALAGLSISLLKQAQKKLLAWA
jgi:sulfonate transport system permease protein